MSPILIEIFGVVVAGFLCVFVSVALYFHRQHQKYDHLPGPPRDRQVYDKEDRMPLMLKSVEFISFWSGHIPSIAKVTAAGGIMDDYVLETSKTYGLVFRLCLWNQVLVVVLDPDCIKDVLVTGNHPKSKQIYARSAGLFGARFLGDGLESQVDSKHWILQRMHLDQWFKPHFIRQFASEFNEFADRFIEYLETFANNKTEIHTSQSFSKLTMHLMFKVAFNIDMGSFYGESHPITINMKTALSGFEALLSNPLVAVNPFKWKFRRDVREALHFIRESARQEMIDRKVAKCNGDYFPRDLLEYIMELKAKYPSVMTDDVLLDNFFTFILGGVETSSNTMSFMLDLLARNPECYKKLQKEIDENVGAVSVITLNEIEKLPYLDMVFKETLRLYPIAKVTFRETIKAYSLSGHRIPVGSDMMVSFYATSRAEQNIRDPTKFLPERFHTDSPERISKYASTPFSAGPHTCIGKKFAEIQIKITISKIMQNFDFNLVSEDTLVLSENATLQAKDGVKCFFYPRETVSAES